MTIQYSSEICIRLGDLIESKINRHVIMLHVGV